MPSDAGTHDVTIYEAPGRATDGFELLAPTAGLAGDAYEARCRWLTRTLAEASA